MAQGVHIAKARVLQYFVAHAPQYCTAVEVAEVLDPATVAAPVLYVQGPEQEPADVPGANDRSFPAVFIDATTAPQRHSQQQMSTGRSYEVLYSIRVVVWCRRTQPRERALVGLDRDRLITALTWCLLDRSGWIVDSFLRADLNSFVTEFGDVYETETGRPQAAGSLTFTVRQLETVTRPMLVDPEALAVELVVFPLTPEQ